MKRNASELRRLIFLKRKSIDDEEVWHLLEKARITFRAFNPCPHTVHGISSNLPIGGNASHQFTTEHPKRGSLLEEQLNPDRYPL